jgi:hypothetical protein
MRLVATLILLVASGCTRPNLDYTGGSGGAGNNDFGQADSGAITCSGDARGCVGAGASGHCVNGTLTPDRTCPEGSTCNATVCGPPASKPGSPQTGQRCDVSGGPEEQQCRALPSANLSCQPFVNVGTQKLVWFCDAAVGAGGAGAHCTRGSECRTGVCTAGGICFFGCHSDLECGSPALRCNSLDVTVEGVTQSAKSCS